MKAETTKRENSTHYRMLKGELRQFAFFPENLPTNHDAVTGLCNFNINFRPSLRLLNFSCEYTFKHDDKPIVKIANLINFEIKDESLKELTIDNQVAFPAELIAYFASLTFGALRGMCILKCQDQGLDLPIMPPQDFNKLFKAPVIFSSVPEKS